MSSESKKQPALERIVVLESGSRHNTAEKGILQEEINRFCNHIGRIIPVSYHNSPEQFHNSISDVISSNDLEKRLLAVIPLSSRKHDVRGAGVTRDYAALRSPEFEAVSAIIIGETKKLHGERKTKVERNIVDWRREDNTESRTRLMTAERYNGVADVLINTCPFPVIIESSKDSSADLLGGRVDKDADTRVISADPDLVNESRRPDDVVPFARDVLIYGFSSDEPENDFRNDFPALRDDLQGYRIHITDEDISSGRMGGDNLRKIIQNIALNTKDGFDRILVGTYVREPSTRRIIPIKNLPEVLEFFLTTLRPKPIGEMGVIYDSVTYSDDMDALNDSGLFGAFQHYVLPNAFESGEDPVVLLKEKRAAAVNKLLIEGSETLRKNAELADAELVSASLHEIVLSEISGEGSKRPSVFDMPPTDTVIPIEEVGVIPSVAELPVGSIENAGLMGADYQPISDEKFNHIMENDVFAVDGLNPSQILSYRSLLSRFSDEGRSKIRSAVNSAASDLTKTDGEQDLYWDLVGVLADDALTIPPADTVATLLKSYLPGLISSRVIPYAPLHEVTKACVTKVTSGGVNDLHEIILAVDRHISDRPKKVREDTKRDVERVLSLEPMKEVLDMASDIGGETGGNLVYNGLTLVSDQPVEYWDKIARIYANVARDDLSNSYDVSDAILQKIADLDNKHWNDYLADVIKDCDEQDKWSQALIVALNVFEKYVAIGDDDSSDSSGVSSDPLTLLEAAGQGNAVKGRASKSYEDIIDADFEEVSGKGIPEEPEVTSPPSDEDFRAVGLDTDDYMSDLESDPSLVVEEASTPLSVDSDGGILTIPRSSESPVVIESSGEDVDSSEDYLQHVTSEDEPVAATPTVAATPATDLEAVMAQEALDEIAGETPLAEEDIEYLSDQPNTPPPIPSGPPGPAPSRDEYSAKVSTQATEEAGGDVTNNLADDAPAIPLTQRKYDDDGLSTPKKSVSDATQPGYASIDSPTDSPIPLPEISSPEDAAIKLLSGQDNPSPDDYSVFEKDVLGVIEEEDDGKYVGQSDDFVEGSVLSRTEVRPEENKDYDGGPIDMADKDSTIKTPGAPELVAPAINYAPPAPVSEADDLEPAPEEPAPAPVPEQPDTGLDDLENAVDAATVDPAANSAPDVSGADDYTQHVNSAAGASVPPAQVPPAAASAPVQPEQPAEKSGWKKPVAYVALTTLLVAAAAVGGHALRTSAADSAFRREASAQAGSLPNLSKTLQANLSEVYGATWTEDGNPEAYARHAKALDAYVKTFPSERESNLLNHEVSYLETRVAEENAAQARIKSAVAEEIAPIKQQNTELQEQVSNLARQLESYQKTGKRRGSKAGRSKVNSGSKSGRGHHKAGGSKGYVPQHKQGGRRAYHSLDAKMIKAPYTGAHKSGHRPGRSYTGQGAP